MKLKNKLKRFFTLSRNHDGFTLVELIVVIAIMAILAGVGTVGYGGYIKAANKGADKKLVGDIMRAIETGTNSYAFVSDDSFKMGKISYPVGFITLSTNGTSVVTSQTEMIPPTEGKCTFETISGIVKVENKNKSYICAAQTNIAYQEVEDIGSITYCTAHSPAANIQSLSGSYVSSWEHTPGKATVCGAEVDNCNDGCEKFELVYTNYPAGAKTITNLDSLYVASSNNSSLCEAAYANQYGTFSQDIKVGPTTEGTLVDSIKAAFGEDLSVLQLKYDGWTSEEGVAYASFYTSAPQIMDDLEELSGLLATASKIDYIRDKLNLTGEYSDGADVTAGVCNTISTNHTPDTWEKAWENAANDNWEGQQGFGLAGMENYAAARKIYNTSFAEYVAKMDPTITDAQLDVIRDFNKGGLDGTSLTMPALVNTDAFTNDASPLKQNFKDAGDPSAGEDGSAFNRVAELYEKYKQSEACKENAKVVYDTLGTIADTSDVANKYAQMNGGDYFDYYGSYVKEMSAMYSAAETASDGGIVIVVSVQTNEDGVTETVFNVSPAAANPRAEK